jgi:ACS family pantothenate transporter-like MFS transporter
MGLHAKLFSMPASKEERRLVLKLDWFILSFCCLMYWVN